MALQNTYKQFLAAPNAALLASDVSLHYITTLVTVNGPTEIVKHFSNQSYKLDKKEETVLSIVEGDKSIAAEYHTVIDFKTGGGAYLPGLDDNFLADRNVTLPIIHFVEFDNGKIQQVRLAWDQGSLLRQIDVIGRTGKNWPIRDGKDQIKLITSSVKCAKMEGDVAEDTYSRKRNNSSNATRDPHASLSLFAPREDLQQESTPAVIAHRSSAKPPARDLSELFVGDNAPQSTTAQSGPGVDTTGSPVKSAIAKAGAGKSYLPSRLFGDDDDGTGSPEKIHGEEKFYKPNPAKYKHFELGDSDDAPKRPVPNVKSKHGSQWSFDDFSTPAKVVPSKVIRTNEVRHWGTEDNEPDASPTQRQKVDKPRRDADIHFEFQDDGVPSEDHRGAGRPRGQGMNNGSGLYQNNVYDEEGAERSKAPLQKVINNPVSIKDRQKDFDPHFTMTDESPSGKPTQAPLPQDRAKAVKMMDANWAPYDSSPNQKENVRQPQSGGTSNVAPKGPLADVTAKRNEYKGISIGGDGMGGKKGSGRRWDIGDDTDRDASPMKNRPGKAQTQRATGGDFWDF